MMEKAEKEMRTEGTTGWRMMMRRWSRGFLEKLLYIIINCFSWIKR